jgi:hypothetical protein
MAEEESSNESPAAAVGFVQMPAGRFYRKIITIPLLVGAQR